MEKFIVKKDDEKIKSINRTVRIKAEYFDKLMELSIKNDISFNKIVNQCLEFALENLAEE